MTSSKTNTSCPFIADRCLALGTRASAAVAAAIVLLVCTFLAVESWPALHQIGVVRFFTDASWHPLSGRFNLLPMLTATVLTTAGAMLLAAPLGVCSGIFSRVYAPAGIDRWYRRLLELLAGIPSVVYGLWGLVVLVPLLASFGGSGQSLLAATLILALMILPTVALTTDAALAAVPAQQLRGAAALGLGRWAIAWRVAVPAARGGIGAGLLLAAARAVGETMAVLMVAGNVVEMPDSIVDPVRTLTANIALELGYATTEHRSVLFVSGLILMAMVGAAILCAQWLSARRRDV